jgi:hypothetical protein
VLVPGKLSQPSAMVMGKARGLPSGASLRYGLAILANIKQAAKAYQGTNTLAYYEKL